MKAETRRQWITTHEWMVKPMRQTEWISGQGILVWLAEVFSALGMGTYLVGLVAGIWGISAWAWWTTVVGWTLIVIFKLPLHFLYLGRKRNFWRAIPRSPTPGRRRGSPAACSSPSCSPPSAS